MKVVHMGPPGIPPSPNDVFDAVTNFHQRFNTKPLAIKMSFNDIRNYMANFMGGAYLLQLEAGKQYDNYVQTPYGPIKLSLIEDDESTTVTTYSPNMNQYNSMGQPNLPSSVIVVDNDEIDTAFEKHVLNGGNV